MMSAEGDQKIRISVGRIQVDQSIRMLIKPDILVF